MSDCDEDYDSDSGGYDIHDPRTREHNAYKISQENAGRARRRYKYGDDVDADGTDIDPDEEDNDDSMERRLQNAREARAWALDEAGRRYRWNATWTGGAHDGVQDEADRRMQDVTRWNGVIDDLGRRIDHGRDARAHNPDSDSDSSSDEESADSVDAEYEKNIGDARESRRRRYDDDDDDEQEMEQWEEVDDDYDEEDDEYEQGEGEEGDEQGRTVYDEYKRYEYEDEYDDED